MDSLEYITSKLEPPFIIGGDFNAAHEAWGSPKSDKRGLSLLSWVVEKKFVVVKLLSLVLLMAVYRGLT